MEEQRQLTATEELSSGCAFRQIDALVHKLEHVREVGRGVVVVEELCNGSIGGAVVQIALAVCLNQYNTLNMILN